MLSYSGGNVWNTRITSNYSRMIQHNLHIAISENNCVFIHYYTCIYTVDIMVGIIQNKSAGIIWNVSRILQHTLCAETFQIFPRFLKMQIGAIHGWFCQNVSSLLQTALAPNAPGASHVSTDLISITADHDARPSRLFEWQWTIHASLESAYFLDTPRSSNPATPSSEHIYVPSALMSRRCAYTSTARVEAKL